MVPDVHDSLSLVVAKLSAQAEARNSDSPIFLFSVSLGARTSWPDCLDVICQSTDRCREDAEQFLEDGVSIIKPTDFANVYKGRGSLKRTIHQQENTLIHQQQLSTTHSIKTNRHP
jgi:hypothetical protein